MAKEKDPKGSKDRDQSKYPDNPNDPNGGEQYPPDEPKHRRAGREHEVHQDILERRMRGGPPPTPELYRKALEQWNKLPGSVVRPPTDVVPEKPEAEDENKGAPKADQDKGGEGGKQ